MVLGYIKSLSLSFTVNPQMNLQTFLTAHGKVNVVCKPDPGRSFVLLGNIFVNLSKFVSISQNMKQLTLRVEDKMYYFFKKLKVYGSIADELYKNTFCYWFCF